MYRYDFTWQYFRHKNFGPDMEVWHQGTLGAWFSQGWELVQIVVTPWENGTLGTHGYYVMAWFRTPA